MLVTKLLCSFLFLALTPVCHAPAGAPLKLAAPQRTVAAKHTLRPWRITRIKGPDGKYYDIADQFAYCTCRWPIGKVASK